MKCTFQHAYYGIINKRTAEPVHTRVDPGLSYLTLEIATYHRERRTQAPAQLRPLNLLPNLNLPLRVHLVPQPQERMHKRQIETPLWPILKLRHHVRIAAPVLEPRFSAWTDLLRERGEGRDVDGTVVLCWKKRAYTVEEVGEK